MQVREYMTASPLCCAPGDSIQKAAMMMAEGDCGAVPVCEGSQAIGIITDRDIAIRAVAENRSPKATKVQDVCTKHCICIGEDEDIGRAMDHMNEHQVRRLIVLDDQGQVCGMLATADIALSDCDRAAAGEVLEQVSMQAC